MAKLCLLLSIVCCLPGWSQRRVDPRNTYERLYAVVGKTGSGTLKDPYRPMFAPLPSQLDVKNGTGIIAYSFQVSDDGKYMLVEFVARTRDAFKAIVSSKEPGVQTFVKSETPQATIETQFKLLKKDFDINKFGVRMP